MSAERFEFREHVLDRVATVTTDELAFSKVQPGFKRKYERVSFRDNTTAFTLAQIVVRTGTDDHLLMEQSSPASATLYWTADPITVMENEQLVILFTGTTAGDDLDAWANGLEIPITEDF
jgi:hypothetical protein